MALLNCVTGLRHSMKTQPLLWTAPLQAIGDIIATGQVVDIKMGVGSLKARDRKVCCPRAGHRMRAQRHV